MMQIYEMPWRVSNEVHRLLMLPFARLWFYLHGVAWGCHWRILGLPVIQRCGGSRIILGDGLCLRSWRTSNPLVPNHPVVLATRTPQARITVGKDCGFTGTTLVAVESITIGDRVLVGSNTTIVDTDFHPLSPYMRKADIHNGNHAPVLIEDDVFIGMQCLILKGVTIGRGAVIGAGSVVTRDVPPETMAAGNPARMLKAL